MQRSDATYFPRLLACLELFVRPKLAAYLSLTSLCASLRRAAGGQYSTWPRSSLLSLRGDELYRQGRHVLVYSFESVEDLALGALISVDHDSLYRYLLPQAFRDPLLSFDFHASRHR